MHHTKIYFRENKSQPRSIPVTVFKKMLYTCGKYYFEQRGKEFQVDKANKVFLNLFCLYFSRNKDFEVCSDISLRKGIYLFGTHGSGKTTAFKIMQLVSKKYNIKSIWFPIISTEEVVAKFNSARNKEYIIKYYSEGVFLFDDLGKEEIANNIYQYGKEDIFIRILSNRYRAFEEKGTITFITSNLDYKAIRNRYGQHIEDRFYSMFNKIQLNGCRR